MAFLSAISAIVGAVGSIMSAVAQAQAAEYQAKIADMNAQISRDNATRAIQASQIDQQEQDSQAKALIGEQLASQSASGLELGGKTQVATRNSAKILSRKDALAVRYGGEMDKYNYLVEEANQTASGQLYRMQASSSMLAGFLGATQSLLGAASSISTNTANRITGTGVRPYAKPASLLG